MIKPSGHVRSPSRILTVVAAFSAVAALISAGVAVWQAVSASSSSDAALKAALSSKRIDYCIRMNRNLEAASSQASWVDTMTKPYGTSARFLSITAAIHFVGDDATIFRQMTPGPIAEKFLNDVFMLRIKLKDMVADGSDYLSQDELRSGLAALQKAQQEMCDRVVAP